MVTLCLDPATFGFYRRIAAQTGRPVEQVLADVLFKLAGELALEALKNNTTQEL